MFRCWDRTREGACSWRDDSACRRGLQYSYSLGRNGWQLRRVVGVSMRHQHHRTCNKHTPCNRYSKHPDIAFHEDALPIYNDESLPPYADRDMTRNTKARREGLLDLARAPGG